MKRILIPVDGSETSLNAVKALLDARRYDPVERVDLLTVQMPLKAGAFGSGLSQEEIDTYYQEEGEAAVQAASALLTQAGVPFDVHIEAGAAAETITRVADETGAHEIFMGTRGLGSVSACDDRSSRGTASRQPEAAESARTPTVSQVRDTQRGQEDAGAGRARALVCTRGRAAKRRPTSWHPPCDENHR